MDNFARNLKILRKLKGLNQEELAQKLGVRKTTISNYETNYSKPNTAMLYQIAEFFSVTVDELLGTLPPTGINEPAPGNPSTVSVPVYASLTSLSDTNPPIQTLQFPAVFLGDGEFFGLRISGDRMNRTALSDGSIAIVRKQGVFDNGNIVVVSIDSEPAFVSRYYMVGDFISLTCDSNNPIYRPLMIRQQEQRVNILGKVIKSIQDVL